MNSKELIYFRKKLNKTQKQMAQLLGTSIKAIHSYEQGWRSVPVHVERHVLFLIARKLGTTVQRRPCWVIKKCPKEHREQCPAREFRAGHMCWFINGTICAGVIHGTWKEKMKMCRKCEVLRPLLDLEASDLEMASTKDSP